MWVVVGAHTGMGNVSKTCKLGTGKSCMTREKHGYRVPTTGCGHRYLWVWVQVTISVPTHYPDPWPIPVVPGDMGGKQSIPHYYNLILPVLLLVLLSRVLAVLMLMVVCSRVIALIVVRAGTGCLQRTRWLVNIWPVTQQVWSWHQYYDW